MIYACKSCGWEFDESRGAPEHRITAGTSFAQLPHAFKCPWCANDKDTFEQLHDLSTNNQTTQVKTMHTTQVNGPITRETNIQQLANEYPEAVVVMAERGLHCFGCHGAQYDTVEAGAKGHGLPDSEIDKMVNEMNQVVATKKDSKAHAKEIKKDIHVTEKAAQKLVELMQAEKKAGYGLRLEVVPGGCSGFSYNLDFDNQAKEGDTIFNQHGVTIYIDANSMSQMTGSKLDYVDGLQGSGFKIDNPNAHSSCGCGKSFA
ncbi:MAG TPA: iron-sulfur cluster assembly accessory protein [Candidatus Binatia bacterium]|nr:iron-sulfur cluster assembly accessory protein [Candidatus Binatia bacterium]